MTNYDNQASRYGSVPRTDVGVTDEGLRAHMVRVYNYMASGLVLTAALAWGTFRLGFVEQADGSLAFTSIGAALFGSPLVWVIMLAPLAFVFVLGFGINRFSAATAQLLFWLFSALMGLSLSSIFLVYTDASIAKVFFITAATFGAMSLYGYTTKRDLTSIGNFLIMGLIGLIIAMIVNIFLASSALDFAISAIGVLIFVGLTAYDTQKVKESYNASMGAELLTKGAIMGALNLYLDFINLFLMLLQLFGNRNQ
jgi:FtsH-binding integral membrane protein